MVRVSKNIMGLMSWIVVAIIGFYTWLFYSILSEMSTVGINTNVLFYFNATVINTLIKVTVSVSLLLLNIRIYQFSQILLYFILGLIALFTLAILITLSSKKGIAVFSWIIFGYLAYCLYVIFIATFQYQGSIFINTWQIIESMFDSIISKYEKKVIIMCLLLLNITYDEIPVYLFYLLAGFGISVILALAVITSSEDSHLKLMKI